MKTLKQFLTEELNDKIRNRYKYLRQGDFPHKDAFRQRLGVSPEAFDSLQKEHGDDKESVKAREKDLAVKQKALKADPNSTWNRGKPERNLSPEKQERYRKLKEIKQKEDIASGKTIQRFPKDRTEYFKARRDRLKQERGITTRGRPVGSVKSFGSDHAKIENFLGSLHNKGHIVRHAIKGSDGHYDQTRMIGRLKAIELVKKHLGIDINMGDMQRKFSHHLQHTTTKPTEILE